MKKATKVVEAKKVVTKAKLSKRIERNLQKIEQFDHKNSGSWDKLQNLSRVIETETFSLSQIIKVYTKRAQSGDIGLTTSQKSVLTFENVKNYVNNSAKYGGLQYFTFHQAKLICNSVIKDNDLSTKRAAKVAKQGGVVGAKADKLVSAVELAK
jgi:hypothetical protein